MSTAKPMWGTCIVTAPLLLPSDSDLNILTLFEAYGKQTILMRHLVQSSKRLAAVQKSGLRSAWTSHNLLQVSTVRGKVRTMTQAFRPFGQELSLWRGGTSKGIFVGQSFFFTTSAKKHKTIVQLCPSHTRCNAEAP